MVYTMRVFAPSPPIVIAQIRDWDHCTLVCWTHIPFVYQIAYAYVNRKN